MKLQIPKYDLSIATSRIQGVSSDKSLAHLGLKTDGDKLQVFITDRIIGVYSSFNAQIITGGCAYVPAKFFIDVVRELPEGVITIESVDSFVIISAGVSNKYTIKLPRIEDKSWRDPPVYESNQFCTLPCQNLKYVIEQIQFCIEQESSRNFGAVGFLHKTKSGALRLVGTDGFRLSYSEIEVNLPEAFLNKGICLSKKALSEIQRMCGEGFETVKLLLSEDETVMVAKTDGYQIFIRLASIKYPNYQGVLPADNLTPIKVSRPYVQSVIKRVLLASDSNKSLKLSFLDNNLTLRSHSAGCSEGKESIELDDYNGENRELSVNGKFLADVFSTIGSDQVFLKVNTQIDPVVVIPQTEPDHCHSMHVIVSIKDTQQN